MEKSTYIDFIGIGAHKAATSWIYCCLKEHPGIYVYSGKETHFFKHEDLFSRGVSYYSGLFSNRKTNQIFGEFSTSYLADHEVPQRIKSLFSNVKIIVCLRNPVDRFEAQMTHLISKNKLSIGLSLLESIKKYPSLFENGLYGKYLTNYFRLFNNDNIHVIFFDDIKSNPCDVVRKLYCFLGVNSEFVPKIINKVYHSDAAVSSGLYRKINKLYLFLLKKKSGRSFIKLLKFFGINSYNLHSLIHFFKKANVGSYNLKPEEKNYLVSAYSDDIVLLQDIINKDLSPWLKII